MKQTAIEWLYNELLNSEPNILEWNKLFEQAKAMERIQIIYAYDDGANERHNDPVTGEEYYNKTYKQ
jgi:hypothetical protein